MTSQQQERPARRFTAAGAAADAPPGTDPLETVIYQGVGAASACWDNLAGAGVFESERARDVAHEMVQWVRAYAAGAAAGAAVAVKVDLEAAVDTDAVQAAVSEALREAPERS